jgi:hypothetical protein
MNNQLTGNTVPNYAYQQYRTIGTCSLCGGPVRVFTGPYLSTVPPTPSCANCGATPSPNYGPVIPMQGRNLTFYTTTVPCKDLAPMASGMWSGVVTTTVPANDEG